MTLLLETVAILAAVVLALNRPAGAGVVRRFLRLLAHIGRHRAWAVALTGGLAFAVSAALTAGAGVPVPSVHDEFSYLLAADTFALGRAANPTHPFWHHFESFHVIHEPSYASKYPPVQGLLLALGQVIGGHPVVGVWLGMGLATAAVTWMLQGWLPPRWALLGGLLMALHPGMLETWGYSYWGGAAAALGGALLFGALRRMLHQPRVSQAHLLAVGVAVLANSRPFEGLGTCLPVAGVLLGWHLRSLPPGTAGPTGAISLLRRVVLPAAAVLAVAATGMAWYNQHVTGNPVLLPYEAYERQYALAPIFVFQAPRPTPDYRHPVMRDFNAGWALGTWRDQRGAANLVKASGRKLLILWQFYLAPVLTVPLFALPWVLRDRWMRFAVLTCGLVLAAMLTSTFLQPSYVAPITSLVFLLTVQGMRHLCLWRRRGQPAGRFLAGALLLITVGAFLGTFAAVTRRDGQRWERQRAHILAEVEGTEGKHLVFVHYGPRHETLHEWVYNRADLDAAKVVWAREMGPERDRELREHFADRQVWVVHADAAPPRLMPLSDVGR